MEAVVVESMEATQEMRDRNIASSSTREAKLLLLLLFISFMVGYYPTWKVLVTAWYSSEDYSPGFFILPICVLTAWQKRNRLAKMEIKPLRQGLVLVVVALLLYLLGRFGEITTLAAFSMVPAIVGVILYLWGRSFLVELLFPISLIVFLIPIPAQIYSELTIPLQLWVSKMSVWIAGLPGIPVYREGNVIFLPQRTLEVVQACSGLRSMMTLLPLSFIFGYFTLNSNFLRVVLFASAVPASILVNVIRVLILIFCDYYFNFDLNSGYAHTVFGVFIFVKALALIMMVRGFLSKWDSPAVSK